jgi:hypothetical protein
MVRREDIGTLPINPSLGQNFPILARFFITFR